MISACVITYNEENNIPRLIESLKDSDEIIIADGGSTDNTVEIAKSLGAIVYSRKDIAYIPTQNDVDNFIKQFGYIPKFTIESVFLNASDIRNEVVTHTKNNWIFFPDADEFVTWDLDEIHILQKKCYLIECKLIQTRDDKGDPTYWGNISKLYRKDKCTWVGKIHEVVAGVNQLHSDKMRIDHFPKLNSQSKVLETLEYIVLKDKDARSMFYLGREYFYYKEYQKALDILERHIKIATWRPEISYAFLIRAKCAWQLHSNNGDDSRKWCLNAIAINPDFKEALYDMSIYTGEGQNKYWKRMSEGATSNDVLFIRK